MKKIFLLFLFLFVISCKKNLPIKTDEIFISKNVHFQENGDFLTLKSGTYKIPHSKLPYKKIMFKCKFGRLYYRIGSRGKNHWRF
jgi:hypothetical protein